MSGNLKIRFARDLPAMAVDVVAPDHKIVHRMMLSGGQAQDVNVPSESSFLRVHLPSGSSVILADPGNLDRTLTRSMLESASASKFPRPQTKTAEAEPEAFQTGQESTGDPFPMQDTAFEWVTGESSESGEGSSGSEFSSRSEVRQHHIRSARTQVAGAPSEYEHPLGDGSVRMKDPFGDPVKGSVQASTGNVFWPVDGPPFARTATLEIALHGGGVTSMKIPGNTRQLWVRADRLKREESLTYSIRLRSSHATADTVLNYLHRGDIAAATVMRGWVKQAASMLQDKMVDPYAAAVGAYLLLSLQEFDEMHHWPRNLADWFDYIPDGCVIWAWQLIHTAPDREQEIHAYLRRAVERGLPVYSLGTRLLLDGLKLLGREGEELLDTLRKSAGAILTSTPLTIWLDATSRPMSIPPDVITYDVAFATEL